MFLSSEQFEFIQTLEAHWKDVVNEYLSLPEQSFEPWVQREMYGNGWSVYGLYAFGKRIEQALQDCPKTAAILDKIPGLTTAGFSRLAPGTHIQPHVGWVKTVYRAHLGLVIPDKCAIRVGDDTRSWQPGKCLIFDDTVEHEAWNYSSQPRVVLLFDFLRPGYSLSDIDEPPPEVKAYLGSKLGKS